MKDVKKIINKILKNKKMLGIVVGGLLALILIIVIIVSLIGGGKENQSQKLSKSLKDLGISFYEKFYYDQLSGDERKEFLEKYKDIGIKVSLDSLSRYKKDSKDEILAEFVNDETEEACDKNSSMVIIYPRNPYGKKDYSIDAVLVCGFEKTETK